MNATVSFSNLLRANDVKPSAVADEIGVSRGTVTKWMRGRIPAERVLDVERITGISRHELRPDLYPKAESAA